MTRIFGFLFGLLLLALVFAGSVPRSLKDAFKSVLAPAAYHRPGPGVSLPAVPKEGDPQFGSKAVPAGKGASGAGAPASERRARPAPGVSLPAVPKEVDPEFGSKAVPAGKGASGAVAPESELVVPPAPKPVFRERAGAINQDLFQPDIPRLRK